MRHTSEKNATEPAPWILRLAYWSILVIHDNPLLPLIKDPYKTLKQAGLKPGQKVLEVGCGPGFFTIPAADIVGKKGLVYAVDLNPHAIKRIQKKIARCGADNIRPMCTNASSTGLADQSIDLGFLFGLPRIAGGEASLLKELNRLLKPGAVLACGKGRSLGKKQIMRLEASGFFLKKTDGGILCFLKNESSETD